MSTEGGQPGTAENVADSLHADLSSAFEASEKVESSAGGTDVSEAARTLAAQRKAPPIDKVDDTTIADSERVGKENADRAAARAAMSPEDRAKAEAEDKAKSETSSTLEAPAHWPSADREMFSKQPAPVQQWMLNRHKAMEADYTRKTQELGGVRRLKETLDEVFAPFREQMQLNGVDDAMAVRQLVGAHAKLQKDPAGGIKWLADSYGIDLKSLVEGNAAADPAGESPTVKALRDQVSTLTGKLDQLTGAQSQQQQHASLSQVQQFAEEKDAQGQPLRPYFDDVAKDIVRMLNGARATGEKLSLQDAYDQAVHANPITREKVLAARDAQRRSKEESERKAKADAAKKAGFDVKGEGAAASVAATSNSLRADLEGAFAAQEGRV